MPSEITETWTINSLNTTWGSSVDPHEIPANGWVNIYRTYYHQSSDTVFNQQVGFTTTEDSTVARTNFSKGWAVVDVDNASMQATFPVRKGEHIVYRSLDKPNTVWNVRFCYSVGDAKRLGLL